MKKVKISLKKLTAKRLIFIQIVYAAFIKGVASLVGLPSSTNYITDVITMLLLVELIFHRMNGYRHDKPIATIRIIITFFIYTVLNWLMHLYSPIYYLWGLRNTFRFYVFFMACAAFLEKEDIPKIINIVFWIFVANLLMCSYQYLILDKRMDFIAGFFGSTEAAGGNGGLMVWSCLVCLTTVVQYIETRGSTIKPIVAIVGALFIATIAEIKILYVMVILILVASSLFTRFSLKKLSVVLIAAIAFPVAIRLLYEIYPNFADFFEWENILRYGSGEQGYTGYGDINRLSSIPYCFEHFLETPFERIFGFGMGACDGSTNFKVVTTDFYLENYHTHYNWFVVPVILLENGIIGLVMFWSVFLVVFKDATICKKIKGINRAYLVMTQVFSLLMIYFSFHSMSSKTETVGYMCYAFLSIPYVLRESK